MKKKGTQKKNNKKNNMNKFSGGPKGLLVAALIVGAGFFFLLQLAQRSQEIEAISYSAFLKHVEQGNVKNIVVSDQEVSGVFKDGNHFETIIADTDANWELFRAHDIAVEVQGSTSQASFWYFVFLSVLIGSLLLVFYFFRQVRGSSGSSGGGNIFTMGKSRAKMFMPSSVKTNFDSVAGAQEAKEDIRDVVEFLKNPEKYSRLGAKMTRGILLVGEPGNGKTLLAKAVAGEANCPFFSISGSDFIEVFVGVGASRVRDLFAQARSHEPAIIFIDEIDAVGRRRGSGQGGGSDEREQTLNQLLTEMDGFQTMGSSVVVIAATNRPDVLDKALLRPGRFDRHVTVPFPDLASREEILTLHAKGVKLDPEVDLKKIARGTPGFSGAQLANLINEAAILAAKTDQETIKNNDFEEARDKILVGAERKTLRQTEEELEMTAYHEAGHALVKVLVPEAMPLHKVTILPRGGALGITWGLPDRDKSQQTLPELLASVKVSCGGRAAEELVYNTTTTGASSDFQKATSTVRELICVHGLSDKVGKAVFGWNEKSWYYSEKAMAAIDEEVRRVLDEEYSAVMNLLTENRDKLELLAKTLLEKETLFADEVYELLGVEAKESHRLS